MKAQHCELFYVAMGVYAVVAICILAVPAETVMEADTTAHQIVRHGFGPQNVALHTASIAVGPEQRAGAAIQTSTAEVLK